MDPLDDGGQLFDLATVPMVTPANGAGSIEAAFGAAPFSVLNAREGWWQDRKREWLRAYHIESDEGRDARTFADGGGADEVSQKILAVSDGQSIFDPVLCELFYRWFTPAAGVVLDPFAGGSVRGVVAGALGRPYVGVDLSVDQVNANRTQAARVADRIVEPCWFVGDAALALPAWSGGEPWADLVFTCPPYYDLEVYSDDPADLSNMPPDDFNETYSRIIEHALANLRDDRFSIWIVGDVRNQRGTFLDLPGVTIAAHRRAGAELYNTAILTTMVGTLALRVRRQFEASRKMGTTHQTVLVFAKGDPRAAAAACDPEPARAIG